MDDVAKSALVSICIPTCNRPAALRAALESCFAQTYASFEIVIGDDSKSSESGRVVAEFQARRPGCIRYHRNVPSLGQAENVNALFNLAAGPRLVLLHDDDLLLPCALQDLAACWENTPSLSAAFGKQYIVDMSGAILSKESEKLNLAYRRTAETAGAVVPGLAGIIRMFPNDGYMVRTERARKIGLRPFSRVGAACDFDFGLRYCANGGKIWFHNGYTSAYRISDDGISRTSITAPLMYRILTEYRAQNEGAQKEGAQRGDALAEEVRHALRREIESAAPRAVSGHARMGEGRQALRILLSSDYAPRDRLRLRFLLHISLTFAALVAGIRGVQVILVAMNGFRSITRLREVVG